jgi:hypothetical protein
VNAEVPARRRQGRRGGARFRQQEQVIELIEPLASQHQAESAFGIVRALVRLPSRIRVGGEP